MIVLERVLLKPVELGVAVFSGDGLEPSWLLLPADWTTQDLHNGCRILLADKRHATSCKDVRNFQ